eukprot:CAMPEP_0195021110 /NCGR_PEP_ID=MMETSP0326_2-20130528/37122_1 /TAXON_ID=2866 ORGANISM="Crypthecodinium cohnii, Strain Seligo" /NCGR_SAMPLE_ID=MMETSP0326_2 /ASSEMBLY_ACC=CAM_ASM_000348 /LENGTH=41 /DNA_ID= /DNA_START= /DNA_END= /DNA_ORIENTATION=
MAVCRARFSSERGDDVKEEEVSATPAVVVGGPGAAGDAAAL